MKVFKMKGLLCCFVWSFTNDYYYTQLSIEKPNTKLKQWYNLRIESNSCKHIAHRQLCAFIGDWSALHCVIICFTVQKQKYFRHKVKICVNIPPSLDIKINQSIQLVCGFFRTKCQIFIIIWWFMEKWSQHNRSAEWMLVPLPCNWLLQFQNHVRCSRISCR